MAMLSHRCIHLICCFLVSLAFTGLTQQLVGQRLSLPKSEYYDGLSAYYQGNFKLAQTAFKRASSGYVTGTGQGQRLWVDAVCSYTMIGECCYQVGDLEGAMFNYRSALDVYIQNQGWLNRVTFPDSFQANESAVARAKINWGITRRQATIAKVPSMQVLFGDRNPQQAIQNGGVFRKPEHRIVNVAEIMRCTALAMTRRREIMGKLSKYAPYTRSLASTTESPVIVAHPYAIAWTQLLHGIALASSENFSKAESLLQSAAQAKGGYDHTLTPLALFELANLQFQQSNYAVASKLYLETTFSAAIFAQWDILSTAIERGFQSDRLTGNKGEYLPLSAMLQGDLYRNLPDTAKCNILLLGAEAKIELSLANEAMGFLNKAKRFIDREMSGSQLAARYFFILAQANALTADVVSSMTSAKTAMGIYSSSSRRLFQIAKTVQMDGNGLITQRTAGELYAELLNEPSNADWIRSPLEALTFLLSPIQNARNRWFQITMSRKEYEKSIEIADNIRRFQFYNTMALGGRLLALRWMLEAPQSMISPAALEQRKIFHLAYPGYAEISAQASEIEKRLGQIEGLPDLGTDEAKAQASLINRLTQLSMAQEVMILNAAYKRNAAPMSFPPRLNFGELQKRLRDKQAAWIFFASGKQIYSFFLTKDSYKLEKIIPLVGIQRYLPTILKKMGNVGVRNAPITQKVLEENGWKSAATELMDLIQPKGVNWSDYDELVIVPDGPLWYLPFEVLQVGEETKDFLCKQLAIRYAPTVSTIVPDGRVVRPINRTLVVAGRLTRNQDRDFGEAEIAKLQEVKPDAVILNRRIPFDSASFSSQIDSLLIWDEIESAEKIRGFDWSPLQVDKEKPRSNISAWMQLPFNGPERYIIPGFHTVAGSGRLRGDGSEMFLTVCGMMASGARTVLISRWAVGGKNDYNLTRNFVAEVDNESAAAAWQRARELTMLDEINPDLEPRVRSLAGGVPLKTDHPFFWAGYMLIDTGAQPVKDVEPPK